MGSSQAKFRQKPACSAAILCQNNICVDPCSAPAEDYCSGEIVRC